MYFRSPFDSQRSARFLSDEPKLDWYEDLKTIPVGTNIFDIEAFNAPEEFGGVLTKIGEIRLKTRLHTSLWGDTKMYFRHKRQRTDYKYWDKAWKRAYRASDMFVP